jgi:hypothetical protein
MYNILNSVILAKIIGNQTKVNTHKTGYVHGDLLQPSENIHKHVKQHFCIIALSFKFRDRLRLGHGDPGWVHPEHFSYM